MQHIYGYYLSIFLFIALPRLAIAQLQNKLLKSSLVISNVALVDYVHIVNSLFKESINLEQPEGRYRPERLIVDLRHLRECDIGHVLREACESMPGLMVQSNSGTYWLLDRTKADTISYLDNKIGNIVLNEANFFDVLETLIGYWPEIAIIYPVTIAKDQEMPLDEYEIIALKRKRVV